MKNLLNPKWIFILNTLPIIVLFFLFFSEFTVIKSLLDEESINLWKSFGLTLGILGLLNFIYAVYLTVKKQNVSVFYGFPALLCYISFIYLYGMYADKILPSSIPQWMVPGETILYAGTFLMPTLAYAFFVLVAHFTPEAKEHTAWKNFVIALLIPASIYLFVQVIFPLWKPFDIDFNTHVLLILFITCTLLFLFFLIRSIYILLTKKGKAWQKYQLIWKIPVAILFPIAGLLVNRSLGSLLSFGSYSNPGVFGDFNSYWFYILASLNGILICLPDLKQQLYRLFLFIGRSITFSYTFYFFMVFLPFLPLSILFILAIGSGFLTLTPLLLFVIHVQALSSDFNFLKNSFSKNKIRCALIAGILVIPLSVTINYLTDKKVLNKTLEYVYTPDYSKTYSINRKSLQKTLNVINYHKEDNNDVILGYRLPYLSSYYNWLVLDNLTLSNTKINAIEKIFFGESSSNLWPEDIPRNKNIQITDITTSSTYDSSQQAWLSWVDLEITKQDDSWDSEYTTGITLPEGCWISDYYLYVDDRKEQGILAEKKSAMWIFSQIWNENRDPGILYYLTGNKVALRVFPFAENETRKTGIQFLHKEPVNLEIDGQAIRLGNEEETRYENYKNGPVIYVSAKQKQTLKEVQRKPYFHFLVDISEGEEKNVPEFSERIKQLTRDYKALSQNAQISFVNSYVATVPLDEHWEETYQSRTFEGGFYLDRAIRTTLVDACQGKKDTYPVLVVVTNSMGRAIVDKDFSDLKMAFPESDLFFETDAENGTLIAHSLRENPREARPSLSEPVLEQPVLEYRLPDNSVAYLPDNNQPDIILKDRVFDISPDDLKEK
ncbi:MAG: MSEP-CTERM sorting domain-containing protein, partial [Tannerella sp.]|nr:MSEP-CTERM sorting domain-containing protein [Tannerella sp.]